MGLWLLVVDFDAFFKNTTPFVQCHIELGFICLKDGTLSWVVIVVGHGVFKFLTLLFKDKIDDGFRLGDRALLLGLVFREVWVLDG